MDVFKPGLSALDAKTFVEESSMGALKETVVLGPTDLSSFVLDVFELEEGVLVGTATKFSSVIGEDRLDGYTVLLEERQDVVVEEMDRSQRHL